MEKKETVDTHKDMLKKMVNVLSTDEIMHIMGIFDNKSDQQVCDLFEEAFEEIIDERI